jgi:N utilization substance protein B
MKGRRSRARRYAVLALYQWQITGQPPTEIRRHFLDDPAWLEAVADSLSVSEGQPTSEAETACDWSLFGQLLEGVPRRVRELDRQLEPALDRPVAQITPVERAVLRLGTYELMFCPEVPYRAVINEAVDLAKLLGADDNSHRYVNGVLDRIARDLGRVDTSGGLATVSGPQGPCPSSS